MKDNVFCLAGKVNVPAEKRDEMNRHVLEILDKCGIRKTVDKTIAGKNVTVVTSVRPNADGIVLFDYSIFEKEKRKISKYDLNTCELYVEDQGYNEFCIVMNMIMVLQEAYTDGGCYFTKSGKRYDAEIYLFLLQGVLGEKITLSGQIRTKDLSEDYSQNAESDFRKLPFYRAIQRNDEDEFLEFWDGSNLLLSQIMKGCIRYWRKQMNDISVPAIISVESFLAKIIARLERSHCRYVDETFVTEFMEHGNEANYQKALILLQQLLDEGQEYFPELTDEQAEEWIIRGSRDSFDYIEISALVSLLTNKKQRNILFGF